MIRHIFEGIDHLTDSPCTPPDKKLAATERTWRRRAGDYRIIYELDAPCSTITIHYIRHRRDVYRNM